MVLCYSSGGVKAILLISAVMAWLLVIRDAEASRFAPVYVCVCVLSEVDDYKKLCSKVVILSELKLR